MALEQWYEEMGEIYLFQSIQPLSGFSWREFRDWFQYEASSISPQFYDYLFTPSNITASYEAYLRSIADKSLSLSLSGSQKLSDRCECTSFP
ncbi:hypothetical protein V1477_001530 [Vespula maculifrons]|uniref:Uncharacterized protein n=1 Tax=Vespula maculifrons TaxID=7453 RepID=A0ABD2D1I0_VESMC